MVFSGRPSRAEDDTPSQMSYYPMLHINDFWMLKENLVELNSTTGAVPVHFSFAPVSLWKFHLMLEFQSQQKTVSGVSMGEMESFKRMMLDTNPYLLGLTFAVTILHSLFDFLAFKNGADMQARTSLIRLDIQFWRGRKTVEGLSLKTQVWNVIAHTVSLLYLLEYETQKVILASVGIGLAIEIWKLLKGASVSIDKSGRFPILRFKEHASYTQKTKEFDDVSSHLNFTAKQV